MAQNNHSDSTRKQLSERSYAVFRCRNTYANEAMLHHHDFYEINFLTSGDVNYTVESRSYHLVSGDVLLVSPMELHQPAPDREKRNFERIVLWIDKGYLEQSGLIGADLTGCFEAGRPWHTNVLRTDGVTRPLLEYTLENLLSESDSREFACELNAQTYLVQIMIQLNRMAERVPQNSEIRDKAESVVISVLRYINEHYHEDLSLDLLANKFFISKYHLSREFNRIVGTSVYRYIIQKRLVIAKQLMSQGVPSTAVYQQCGFGDYSNFYRAFKSEYQISPKEFIAGLKEENRRAEEMRRERNWFHREKG